MTRQQTMSTRMRNQHTGVYTFEELTDWIFLRIEYLNTLPQVLCTPLTNTTTQENEGIMMCIIRDGN